MEPDDPANNDRVFGQPLASGDQRLGQFRKAVEYPIGQPFADHGPQVLGRLQFRGTRRLAVQNHVRWYLQTLGRVAARTVQDQHQHLAPVRVGRPAKSTRAWPMHAALALVKMAALGAVLLAVGLARHALAIR